MTKMKVTLLDSMGTDLDVVNAARVSFDKVSSSLTKQDEKLIKYLADHNHWSPFSHCYLKFRIKAPIFVARQLQKHTVGLAWNEVSRRYVDSEPEFYMPTSWRKRADNVKQGSGGAVPDEVSEEINILTEEVNSELLELYKSLCTELCPEQARMILPQSMMTEWIWSGSLYAFARVCNLRLDMHTQAETRAVANMFLKEMLELFPVSTEALLGKEVLVGTNSN